MISRWGNRSTFDNLITGGILIASYLLRLSHTLYYPALSRDSYSYINIIERTGIIPDIFFLESKYPLFYQLFRFPVVLLNQKTVYVGRALNIVLGTLTVYIVIAFSRQISSNRLIWVTSGLIASTYPSLVHLSSQIQRECLYLFFCSLMLLFAFKFLFRNRMRYIVYLAFLSGCNSLTRHESMELFPFISLFILCGSKEKGFSQSLILVGLYWALVALSMLSLLFLLGHFHIYMEALSSELRAIFLFVFH